MEQNMKKGRVKGTVLFTVVAVMMVLVVFLMSTLILTTSAQRRTYYTYFETQAQYAATAALETVQNSVYSNEGFFTWMTNEAKNIVKELIRPARTVTVPAGFSCLYFFVEYYGNIFRDKL